MIVCGQVEAASGCVGVCLWQAGCRMLGARLDTKRESSQHTRQLTSHRLERWMSQHPPAACVTLPEYLDVVVGLRVRFGGLDKGVCSTTKNYVLVVSQ